MGLLSFLWERFLHDVRSAVYFNVLNEDSQCSEITQIGKTLIPFLTFPESVLLYFNLDKEISIVEYRVALKMKV